MVLLLLLVGSVVAEEPDGAVAAAARWTGPGGAASGSRSSAALPVMGDVEEAWNLRPPKGCARIETPPCLWHGRGFFVASGSSGRFLFSFDVRTGKTIASKKVLSKTLMDEHGGLPSVHVWDRMVMVEQWGRPMIGYRHSARSLAVGWRPPNAQGALNMTVFENEVYLPSIANAVECRRPGSGWVWSASRPRSRIYTETLRGVRVHVESSVIPLSRPAVLGRHVFVLLGIVRVRSARNQRITSYAPAVHVYLRSNGKHVGFRELPENLGEATIPIKPGRLLATPTTLYVESPLPLKTRTGKLSRPYLRIPWREVGKQVLFDKPRVTQFALPPAHHALGTIALLRKPELTWGLLKGAKWALLARVGQQPELFTSLVPPTVVGDIVYFGNFAVDLATREILWRLPVKRVTFTAVPADRLVLVVDNGEVLRAFRERGGP